MLPSGGRICYHFRSNCLYVLIIKTVFFLSFLSFFSPPSFFLYFFKNLFIWLHQVLVAACGISLQPQPHGLQPTRLLCPQDFPGKSSGVGCHFLLQGIFPTQGSNPGLLHCRETLYCLSYQGIPDQGPNPGSLLWEHKILITREVPSSSLLFLSRVLLLF